MYLIVDGFTNSVQEQSRRYQVKEFFRGDTILQQIQKGGKQAERCRSRNCREQKLGYMLNAILMSYSHIGYLIDVLKEDDRTVEYLKSKIKFKSIKQKTKN